MQAEFLTIAEVAQLLKIGQRTVYQLACEGRIGGAAKVGSQWRFDRVALHKWLSAGGEAAEGLYQAEDDTEYREGELEAHR